MKVIPEALRLHYAQEVTTIASCWKVELFSGEVLGFTDATQDLVIDGQIYKANAGHNTSAIHSSDALNVDNMEVIGMLSNDAITDAELKAGKWDKARVTLFEVNYNDLSMGMNILRVGYLGQISAGRSSFTAELRGLAQMLQNPIGLTYGPDCTASFCDARCKLNIADWTVQGTIIGLSGNRTITMTCGASQRNYANGKIIMINGAAKGCAMEIKSHTPGDPGTIVLHELFAITPGIGDMFEITAGCDKLVSTCKTVYNNVINFRGFPDLPGLDKMVSGS